MQHEKWNALILRVKEWFAINNVDHAVVGFSGGVDSATTAALMHAAGINVSAISVIISGMRYHLSSPYDMFDFAKLYKGMEADPFTVPMAGQMSNAGKEAALPIIRNAYFYAKAAELREIGCKPIVVGTANFDETSYLGFWGKASDAAQDFYPISHLHKSEVRELAEYLGVPREIIYAVPSGDLQWSGDLNDYKMIGATYDQIEAVAKLVYHPRMPTMDELHLFIQKNVDNPKVFIENIVRNSHKYELPFPGKHISDKLEHFRYYAYPALKHVALTYEFKLS